MLQEIIQTIDQIWQRNSYHKKRGFRIREQSADKAGCHLVEEAVELLAEVMDEDGTTDAVLDEAADVLICFSRVLYDHGINLGQLEARAYRKMHDAWTDDPSEITAKIPGTTRRGR